MFATPSRFIRPHEKVFADARRALDVCLRMPLMVRVQIVDGLAMLSGRVCCRNERAKAEAMVRQVPGVRRVVNRIVVKSEEPA